MPGSAPRADVWVVVEHPAGWGDAALARAGHGVRVLMARGPRPAGTTGPPPREGAPGVRVWVSRGWPQPELRVGTVADPAEVATWDLAAIADGVPPGWGRTDPDPLLLVCANGRRDRCCGHAGRRLAESLWNRPGGDRVLTCTHLGGHRFAPTALLLPSGALHGRLSLDAAAGLVGAALAGTTPGATLRGFSMLPEEVQVAEAHVRAMTGHDAIRPLPARVLSRDVDRCVVEVTPPVDGQGRPAEPVVVRLGRRERAVLASCGRAPEPMRRWEVDDAGPARHRAHVPGGASPQPDDPVTRL